MHLPSQMKYARFGSYCCSYSQNVVGGQTLVGALIPRKEMVPGAADPFVIQKTSRGLAESCHDYFIFSWFDLDLLAALCPG